MQWLNDLPFGGSTVVQIGVLAACGIAVLVALAIVYRLVFAHRLKVPGGRTRQPRLGLVDAFSLDGQRQLVLIRRDNVEHLVMIGGPNDVLVESQINRALAISRENNLAPAQPAARRAEPSVVPLPVQPAASGASAPPPSVPAAQAPPVRAQAVPPSASPTAPMQVAPTPTAPSPSAAPVAVRGVQSAARVAEAARPIPAVQPQSRPLPPRPSMPPPIAPAGRPNIARPANAHPQAAPPTQPPAASSPADAAKPGPSQPQPAHAAPR